MVIKTNENGTVSFLLLTGKDKVQGSMLESEAYELLRKGKTRKQGNTITVDNKFIFEIEDDEDDVPLSAVKKEDKPLSSAKEKPLSNKPLTRKKDKRK